MNLETARAELEKRFNRIVGVSATNLCTRCGWCIDSCHVYKATKDPEHSPVAKTERVRKVLRKSHDWISKIFPSWTGAKELTEEEFADWVNVAYKNCTLCERCVVNCPMAVETPQILGAVRGTLTAMGKNPEILSQLADAAIAREDGLDFMREFYKKQISSLEKEVAEKLGNPNARIPLEEEADILYVPLSGAHTIVPPAMLFNLAGASWTLSMFEASNYGLFIGDPVRGKRIVSRVLKEAERLNVKEIVISECGHAYGVFKWEAPKWFKGEYDFKIRSILEVADEYIQKGLIKFDPSKNNKSVTYHDPCNIGRKGGLFEEPRRIIKSAVSDYREMIPSKVENYCCGGGAGLVAEESWKDFRLKCGTTKVEQIRDTGAEVALTSCDNCLHQIQELSTEYDLGIEVSNITQYIANSILT